MSSKAKCESVAEGASLPARVPFLGGRNSALAAGLLPSKNCCKASLSPSTSMVLPAASSPTGLSGAGVQLTRESRLGAPPKNLHFLFAGGKCVFSIELCPETQRDGYVLQMIVKPGGHSTTQGKKCPERDVVASPSILLWGSVSPLPLAFVLRTFVLSDTCSYINGQ